MVRFKAEQAASVLRVVFVLGQDVRQERLGFVLAEIIDGEMLDAFGPIGGYNFLWAWVTGRTAGLGAAEKVAALAAQRDGL